MQRIITLEYPEDFGEKRIDKKHLAMTLKAFRHDDRFVVKEITDQVAQIIWNVYIDGS